MKVKCGLSEVRVLNLTHPAILEAAVGFGGFTRIKTLIGAPQVAVSPWQAVVTQSAVPSHSVSASAATCKGHDRTGCFVHIVPKREPFRQFNDVDSH